MHYGKALLSLTLAALLALNLIACGGNEPPQSDSAPESQLESQIESSAESTDEANEELPAATPAPQQNPTSPPPSSKPAPAQPRAGSGGSLNGATTYVVPSTGGGHMTGGAVTITP